MKRKGLKYIIAGIISLAFDYGLLLLLYYAVGLRLGVATTIAFIVGLIVNFSLIRYWVFEQSNRGAEAMVWQSASYGFLTLFNLLVTNLVILYLSKRGIGPEISKILTTAMIACWNFVAYRTLIFKEEPRRSEEPAAKP